MYGCAASDGPTKFPVSGTVTFDGQPVPSGDIIFYSTEKELGPDAGMIVDGKFTLQAKAGKKKVQIRASREVPGKTQPHPSGGTMPVTEDYIPARYNTETVLKAEIVSDGLNDLDFSLTSSEKKP